MSAIMSAATDLSCRPVNVFERYGEWLYQAVELQRHINLELEARKRRYGSKCRRHELIAMSLQACKRLIRTYLYGPAVCCKPDVSDGGIGLALLYPARE
jgi:hypothetical protein